MVNSETGERELAYIVQVDDIKPIEKADRLECAVIGGWHCVVGKGEFHKGDKAIYVEIDSRCPIEKEPWSRMEFLVSKHGKVKSQKIRGCISQGLLLSLNDFPELKDRKAGDFLTKELGITYYMEEDNVRKAKVDPRAKYKAMACRHNKLFRHQPFRWLMKREWGRKLLFKFFGKKKDVDITKFPTKFPNIVKSDEERIENCAWILQNKKPFARSFKADGSSLTAILERIPASGLKPERYEYYVCSRNRRILNPKQESFYNEDKEDNAYWATAEKYNLEGILRSYLKSNPKLTYVGVQGELCGVKIQQNPQKLSENHLFLFHLADSERMRTPAELLNFCRKYNLEHVTYDKMDYILPDDFDEFKKEADQMYPPEMCEGHKDCISEGYVYVQADDARIHFKNKSNRYLLKHGE